MATKVCEKSQSIGGVTFAFANGKTLQCRIADLPQAMRDQALKHGISARVGDSFAGAAKQPHPVDWAYDTACEVWNAMCKGEWSTRESTGGVLAEALAMVTKRELGDCQAVLAKLDDEKKAALKRQPKIKLALAAIALEKAKVAAAGTEFDLNDL